jgi:isopenicillin N synthase-like dioxygenase
MSTASIPLLDFGRSNARDVREALLESGSFLLRDPHVDVARCEAALSDAADFFALPGVVKHELAIESSPHFRGYSEMRNDRDWREQIHFGRELPAIGAEPSHFRLQGPNLWPPDAAWRERMLEYLGLVEDVGRRLLSLIAESLELPATSFVDGTRDGYLLMKLIRYHPQPAPTAQRSGVAPHVDFSWITLTLQDASGGLSVRTPAGDWIDVPPMRGAWSVNIGELLQFATGNAYVATPHRVVNPSTRGSRISIPFFLNPKPSTIVLPLQVPRERCARVRTETTHVHRVLDPDSDPVPFVFGEAEWRRKGQNVWCASCVGG